MGKYICQWYLRQRFDFQNIWIIHTSPLQEDKQPNLKFLCFGPLGGSLCVSSHLCLADRKTTTFHSWMLSGFLFGSGGTGWGAQLGFNTPHFSGGNTQLLKYPSRSSAATHGSPPSPLVAPPHLLPVLLWWSGFFCLPLVVRLLSSQCSVGYSGWFLYNLVVIPIWF